MINDQDRLWMDFDWDGGARCVLDLVLLARDMDLFEYFLDEEADGGRIDPRVMEGFERWLHGALRMHGITVQGA